MLDEHGLPVPDGRLLPIAIGDCGQVVDRDGEEIELWVDPEFFTHAANWIGPCREIVRRLGKPQALSLAEVEAIMLDAANLWSEMQEDAKGGGDETGV